MAINNKVKTCSVDGCCNRSLAYGFCNMHYQRFVKTGEIIKRKRVKNTIVDLEECVEVILTNKYGEEVARAKVDKEDEHIVKEVKWHRNTKGYAAGWSNGKVVLMHRLIGNFTGFTDHINRDRLDNRKSNLREANRHENAINCKINTKNSVGLKGVCRHGGKYQARITVNGSRMSLGHFKDALSAALAYDQAAVELHGKFAATNFSCDNPIFATRGYQP